MEKIRTAANNIIVKIIFAIIILAFIFTGVGGLFGMQGNSADDERLYIAKVDGEGISRALFNQQVDQAMEQFVSAGQNADSLRPMIRSRVLSSLIEDNLSYKLSDTLGLKISDEQVKKIITQQPVFFVDGVFNNQRFLSVLQQYGYTPDSYANSLRADIQKNQLLQALLLSDFSLPVESDMSELVTQKRAGSYARVDITDVVDKSALAVSEDEIKQYYQDNTENFNRGERVKLKFLVNRYNDAMKEAKEPTDEEIKAVYDKNQADYAQPAKYEFTLVTTDNEKDAQQIDSQVKSTKNLSDIDSAKLTNLGWFTESAIPDYLKDIPIQKGESKVITIDGNYYVAFLQDIQNAEVLPIDYVSDKIKAQLLTERANSIYDTKNQQLLAAREKYNTLEDIATAAGVELTESVDWQTKTDADSLVKNPELQSYIFNDENIKDGLATKIVSELVELNDPKETYILQVLDYRPEGIAPYEDVHNQVSQKLTEEKSAKLFREALQQIVDNLNNGVADNRINFANPYEITRVSTDLPNTTVEMIYSIPRPIGDKQSYGMDMNKYNSAIIAVLTKVENGESTDMSTELENVNQNAEYEIFNNYLRSKAKIDMMSDIEM